MANIYVQAVHMAHPVARINVLSWALDHTVVPTILQYFLNII